MNRNLNRRQFLRTAAGAAAAATSGITTTTGATRAVAVVVDPADAVASSVAGQWAAKELKDALIERGVHAQICQNALQAPASQLRIMVSAMTSPTGAVALNAAGARAELVPEALALCQQKGDVWTCGYDPRGLTYALLELTDRVRLYVDPLAALAVPKPVVERPANDSTQCHAAVHQ